VATAKPSAAVQTSGRFLGLGLATVVNIINPDGILPAGEITNAWIDRRTGAIAMAERTLTDAAARTPLRITPAQEYPRLRGAAALSQRQHSPRHGSLRVELA